MAGSHAVRICQLGFRISRLEIYRTESLRFGQQLQRHWVLRYTLRSAGARGVAASVFYRHCAPLERKARADFSTLGVIHDSDLSRVPP